MVLLMPKFDLYWEERAIERYKCVGVEADTPREAWERMWNGEIDEWPEVIDREVIEINDLETEEV